MVVEIREMTEADIEPLGKMYAAVYIARNIGEKWTDERAADLMSYYLDAQPDLCLVAVEDGKLVGGFLTLIKPWWDGYHMTEGEIFVDTKCQTKGIGKQLMKAMLSRSIEKYNCVEIEGVCYIKNEFPYCWYEGMGLKKSDKYVYISGIPKKMLENL